MGRLRFSGSGGKDPRTNAYVTFRPHRSSSILDLPSSIPFSSERLSSLNLSIFGNQGGYVAADGVDGLDVPLELQRRPRIG